MANEIVTTAQDRMKQSLGSLQRDLGVEFYSIEPNQSQRPPQQ